MKTYRIVGKTNGWIAQRDSTFGGKCKIIIAEGLTLREAKSKMIDFFNEDYDTCYSNWGLCVMNNADAGTTSDGMYYYEYDSRYYRIEEEVITLQDIADCYNENSDNILDVFNLINQGGFEDLTGEQWLICRNPRTGKEVRINDKGKAYVTD